MVPQTKSIRFFVQMLPAYFAPVKPVSTMANTVCMKKTSVAPSRSHNVSIALIYLSSCLCPK